jgi:hypothetical protein
MDAWASVLVSGLLGDGVERPNGETWVQTIWDWLGTDEGLRCKDEADARYWPKHLDKEDSAALTMMGFGFVASVAEQASGSGVVASIDTMRLRMQNEPNYSSAN